jgi:hypothetical protein
MAMDLDMVAAALRQDAADVATYARVLTGTLADALPPGSVTVEHERTLADRLRGRDGHPSRIVVRLGERTLFLAGGGRLVAEIHHEVRGVVLSRDRCHSTSGWRPWRGSSSYRPMPMRAPRRRCAVWWLEDHEGIRLG